MMSTAHAAIQPSLTASWSTYEASHSHKRNKRNFSRVLLSGNGAMFIAMLGIITCIIIGYTHDEYFSLWTQVASHIALILFATVVKIGYVMRCIGLHGLGATQL
ncbi:hypothetical protein [Shewanella nanhaiensis]|uniref:Uncharacterized protein n=1 Tax=Shewanella nanhaiensis TaxID=2864872 RepID=A0ABS7E210_9GAMM|nr:hypothetical protein [Shewanella nanhaiensis]MBW8183196.1 hypothetical protein [Shewanella nanhaiensis]